MRRVLNITIGLCVTLFGLYLWTSTEATIYTISMYLSLFFLLAAFVGLFAIKQTKVKYVPYEQLLLSTFIGIIFLFLPMISYVLLTVLFIGVFFLFALFYCIRIFIQKQDKVPTQIIQIILALVFIVYAIVMLFNPKLGGQTLAKIVACFIVMNGLSYFFQPIE